MYTCIKRYHVQGFCCGCSLRTGCFVIGIIELLFSVVQAALLVVPPLLNVDQSLYIIGQVTFCTLTFITNIFLLIGIHKNEQKYLIPWLIFKEIVCIMGTIVVGILFVFALTTADYLIGVAGIVLIVLLGIFYYFWNCLWSFYMELVDQGHYIAPLV